MHTGFHAKTLPIHLRGKHWESSRFVRATLAEVFRNGQPCPCADNLPARAVAACKDASETSNGGQEGTSLGFPRTYGRGDAIPQGTVKMICRPQVAYADLSAQRHRIVTTLQ